MIRERRLSSILVAACVASLSPLGASRATPPDGGVDAGVTGPLPAFDATAVPTERSRPPTREEWRAATPVAVSRSHTPCRAYRVREWMKINCSHFAASGGAEVAGPPEGVPILGPAADKDLPPTTLGYTNRPVELVFPFRPGTAHVFQLLAYEYDAVAGFANRGPRRCW